MNSGHVCMLSRVEWQGQTWAIYKWVSCDAANWNVLFACFIKHPSDTMWIRLFPPRPGRSWCRLPQPPSPPARFQQDPALVLCTEPEPVAILSLQSWSATISKAIGVICICLRSLSHFLAHWTRTEPIWSVARCHPVFSFTWAWFDMVLLFIRAYSFSDQWDLLEISSSPYFILQSAGGAKWG